MPKTTERPWQVLWGMTVLAKDAKSAAKKAKRHQLKLTGAGGFDVRDERGRSTIVNLDNV